MYKPRTQTSPPHSPYCSSRKNTPDSTMHHLSYLSLFLNKIQLFSWPLKNISYLALHNICNIKHVTRPSAFPPFRLSALTPFRPSAFPPFRPSAFPPFRPSAFPPFRLSALPPFRPSAFPPFRLSALPPFRPSAFPPFRLSYPLTPK